MNTSNEFKCLFKFNDKNYSIVISDNNNKIQFSQLLSRIEVIVKQKIVFNSYLFEVFDKQINGYSVINSDKQLIENLSRIRVSLNSNDKSDNNIINKMAEKYSYNSMNNKPMVNANYEKIESHESRKLIKSGTKADRNVKSLFDSQLIKTVKELNHIFNTDPEIGWNSVSDQLFNSGFEDSTPELCRRLFQTIISNYIPVLLNSQTYQIASNEYQYFSILHALDLKPFLKPKTYKKVIIKSKKLQSNTNSINNNNSCLDLKGKTNPINRNNDTTRNKSKTQPSINDNKNINQSSIYPNKSSKSHYRDNIVITVQNNQSVRSERKIVLKSSNDSDSYQIIRKNSFDSNQSKPSNRSVSRQSNSSGSVNFINTDRPNKSAVKAYNSRESNSVIRNYNTAKGNGNKCQEFVKQINLMTEIAESVLKYSTDYFTKDLFLEQPSTVWQMIAIEINNSTDKSFDAIYYKQVFEKAIQEYLVLLRMPFNRNIDKKLLYFYDLMNQINVQHLVDPITYQTVNSLRKKVPPIDSALNFRESFNKQNKQSIKPVNSLSQNCEPKAILKRHVVNNDVINKNDNYISNQNNNREKNTYQRSYASSNSYFIKNLDLITTKNIDENQIRGKILNASDISEQIKCFMDEILLNKNDYHKRVLLKNKLEEIINKHGIDCKLHFFGSTDNEVGFRDSDIDIFIEIKHLNNIVMKIDYNTAIEELKDIKKVLKLYLNFFIPKPIESLRCPLIKLDFKFLGQKFKNTDKELFEELDNYGISCDISISNGLGPHNSKLIRLFCEIEPRFQVLAVILRFWAKKNGFIGSHLNGMSSYGFTQLVIFFCQSLSPPLLPTVDYLRQLSKKSLIVDDWECSFCDDIDLIKKSDNRSTVIELLKMFFLFYSTFEFTTQVIRPKTGTSEHKHEYNKAKAKFDPNSRELNFKMTSICCIEDPFNLEHNLTTGLRPYVFDKFVEYVKQIADKQESIFNDQIDKQSDWGISKIITEFDPTDGSLGSSTHRCVPNVKLILKSCEITIRDIIKTLANEYCNITEILLENVYQIETQLIGKWDVILGNISPFAEYKLVFKQMDLKVIDYNIREETKNSLNLKQWKEMLDFDKEKVISDQIIDKFCDQKFDSLTLECCIVLVMNARINGPSIDWQINYIKSETQGVKGYQNLIKKFINRLFESLPKIIDQNYYK